MLARLCARGDLIPVVVEGVERAAADPPRGLRSGRCWTWPLRWMCRPARRGFIGPLDNLIWDRDLIRWLFDFDYTWEVYKPAEQRQYGHYVLPVLYGDRSSPASSRSSIARQAC